MTSFSPPNHCHTAGPSPDLSSSIQSVSFCNYRQAFSFPDENARTMSKSVYENEDDNNRNDNDDEDDCNSIRKFSIGFITGGDYDVWISQSSSVEEHRSRLLRRLGLTETETEYSGTDLKLGKSVSADQLEIEVSSCYNHVIARSKSADHELSDNNYSYNHNPVIEETVNNNNKNNNSNVDNYKHVLVKSPGSKPPTGKIIRRSEEIVKCDLSNLSVNSTGGDGNELDLDLIQIV